MGIIIFAALVLIIALSIVMKLAMDKDKQEEVQMTSEMIDEAPVEPVKKPKKVSSKKKTASKKRGVK